MKTVQLFFSCLLLVIFASCAQKNTRKFITVKNSIDIPRSFETIELTKQFLKVDSLNNIGIKDVNSDKLAITQLVDLDDDGIMDQLLFQPEVAPNSETTYEIITISENEKPETNNWCYSRFVPERTDDYTWENDKVAFRVYGPTAQKMIEENIPGGTLSSGVDAWLKKVSYPIINKWYKKTVVDKTGSYHEDTGEGLDNFHVGASRGVGGIAIKKDSSYYVSKNYTNWKTITTGPIRTSFYLNYADWDADGTNIKDSKIISLDYGSNLSKFEITLEGSNTISAGLALHEKDGEVNGSKMHNWVSYWQPHANSELGTAIVAPKKYFIDFETYNTEKTDLSNAFSHLNVIDNKVIYYAGFGWKESGQFSTKDEWEKYLNQFSEKIEHPLIVSLKN